MLVVNRPPTKGSGVAKASCSSLGLSCLLGFNFAAKTQQYYNVEGSGSFPDSTVSNASLPDFVIIAALRGMAEVILRSSLVLLR